MSRLVNGSFYHSEPCPIYGQANFWQAKLSNNGYRLHAETLPTSCLFLYPHWSLVSKVFTVMQLKMYNSVSEVSLDQLINMWRLSAGAAEKSLFCNDRKRTSTRVDTLVPTSRQGQGCVLASLILHCGREPIWSMNEPWQGDSMALASKNRVFQNILPCCLSWKHRMPPKDNLLGTSSRIWQFYIDPPLSSKPYFEYLGLWRLWWSSSAQTGLLSDSGLSEYDHDFRSWRLQF